MSQSKFELNSTTIDGKENETELFEFLAPLELQDSPPNLLGYLFSGLSSTDDFDLLYSQGIPTLTNPPTEVINNSNIPVQFAQAPLPSTQLLSIDSISISSDQSKIANVNFHDHLSSYTANPVESKKRKSPDSIETLEDYPTENPSAKLKSNKTLKPLNQLTDSGALRRQWVYLDLMEESIPLKEKLVPLHILPKDLDTRTKKQPVLLMGRKIITLGYWYSLNSRDQEKYFFNNGEPVPKEKLCQEAKNTKKIDGRKIVTAGAFYRRKFKFVEHEGSRALTLNEARQLQFNPIDQKLYFNGMMVIWDTRRSSSSEATASPSSKISHMSPRVVIEKTVDATITSSSSEGTNEISVHHDTRRRSESDNQSLLQAPETKKVGPENNPQAEKLIFEQPGVKLLLEVSSPTPALIEKIKDKVKEIHDLCQQESFYKAAYAQKTSPLLFALSEHKEVSEQDKDKRFYTNTDPILPL